MPSPAAFVSSLVALAVLAVLSLLMLPGFVAVTRERVERFAIRQAVVITVDNGERVIRYLATTRRWRGGLLVLGIATVVIYRVVSNQAISISTVTAFAGWFAGAVIAEWRVDAGARGPLAAASLRRRRLADYVAGQVLQLLTGLWALVGGLALAGLIAALVSDREARGTAVGILAAVVILGGMVWLVARRVLTRAQPLVAADVLEADNAIRGRSLNVLVGSGLAIGGYLGVLALHALRLDSHSAAAFLAHLIGYVALPLLGVDVATRRRDVRLAVLPRSRVA